MACVHRFGGVAVFITACFVWTLLAPGAEEQDAGAEKPQHVGEGETGAIGK
jgi:hypothetical protein